MNTTLNIMLLLAMSMLYNMMAGMFGIEHWYFLALAPLLISSIGFVALSCSRLCNHLSLALVPLMALPLLLASHSMEQLVLPVLLHAALMSTILYPLLNAVLGRTTKPARELNTP